MRKYLLPIFCLLILSSPLLSGDLAFKSFNFTTELHFGNDTEIEIDFENLNQNFSVMNIQFMMRVRRTSDQQVMYQDQQMMQELPAGQPTTVNFGSLDYQQLDENEEYIIEVGTEQQFDEDLSNNNGEHIFNLLPPFDRDWVQMHVMAFLEDNFTQMELENVHAYLGQDILPLGTEIKTFDEDELVAQIDRDLWFVYLDWDIYGKYSKPVTYMLVSEGQDDEFYDVNWYPYINDELWIPNPLSSEQLIFGEPGEFISEIPPLDFSKPSPTVKKDSVCAIIVTGKDSVLQSALDEDRDWIRYMLQKNGLGEELSDENITVLNKATKAEIKAAIEDAKKKCKKIYFYYTGHGSKSGKMCTNDKSSEWMTYDELFKELFGTDADEIVVILDACYSGKAVKSAEDNDKKGKKVIVLASSDSTKVSRVEWKRSSIDTNKRYCESMFSRALVLCAEDSLANKNKDTIVSAKEAFDWAKERDTTMSNAQNPQIYSIDNRFNLERIRELTQSFFDVNYSTKDLTHTVAQPYPKLIKAGTLIETFDTEEYSKQLENDSYLVLVDWNINDKYSKSVTYLIFDENSTEPVVEDVNWFPIVDGDPWNFDPLLPVPEPPGFDPFFIGGSPVLLPIPEPPFDLTVPPVPTVPKDSVCAIIVTGNDPTMQTAFNNDRNYIKWFLQQNGLGEQLGEDNVEVLDKGTKEEVVAAIKKLKENYNKIYFFYAGHGSKSGKICTNDSSKYWLSYQELFKELYCTNAEEITVVIDACYAGLAIGAAKADTTRGDRKVNVFTSSDSLKTSRNIWYKGRVDTTKRYCYGYFTRNLVLCSMDSTADTNKDTIVSFEEAFDWVREQNPTFGSDSINERQNPQGFVEDTRVVVDIAELIKRATQSIYDQSPIGTEVYWNPKPIPDTWVIHPMYYPDIAFPNTKDSEGLYYGWFDYYPDANFEHETVIFCFDSVTGILDTLQALWYPVMIDDQGNEIFFVDELIHGIPWTSLDSTISEIISEEAESVSQDSVCAILVSGTDKREARREDIYKQQVTFECNIEDFKKELTTEKLGPKLEEKDVQLLKGIGKDSLCTILEGMVGKYKKVYFYYSGHGSKNGYMALGDSRDDWMKFSDLIKKISEINADDSCILIDACYSGYAADAAKDSTNFKGKGVTVVTSSNDKKRSWNGYDKVDQDGKKWKGYSYYSRAFFECLGAPDADYNLDTVVSYTEAFNWVKKQKPRTYEDQDVDSLQCPQLTTGTSGTIDSANKKITFGDNDLTIDNYEIDSFFDIYLRLEVDQKMLESQDEKIIDLSQNRMWRIDSDLENGTFTADLRFQLREQYENLNPGIDQIIGMCWRENENDSWKPKYPSVYSASDNTVLCGETDHFSDWVAGVIKQDDSSVESEFLIDGVVYGPNPFKNLFHFEFDLPEPTSMSIEIVDMTGNTIDAIPFSNYPNGISVVNLDGTKYPSGTYYCRLISANSVKTIKLVKN
ncbi:MAG: hypothetical protein Kapaf2KO_09550 [Candidatus Kapaibacteriales bacterium]